jgi:histidinol-phosphate aminotransferase
MSDILEFIRPEIRRMRRYRNAEFEAGMIRLNANETPWRPPGDVTRAGLNWYPDPRPVELTAQLARHYGVDIEQILVTRGSSEAIDVLIRGVCRPDRDRIVICPPTFGMYEAYAQVQGAGIVRVPLLRDQGYSLDKTTLLSARQAGSKLLFLCSPNNPTGNSFPLSDIADLAQAWRDTGLVVVDAAYVEFAETDHTRELLASHPNVVVLRTLSKAMSLAGVRCGALLGPAAVVQALSGVLPPYTFPTLCAEAVVAALAAANEGEWRRRTALLREERERLARGLATVAGVSRVWPSEANFVLINCEDPKALAGKARSGHILVRDFSWDPCLPGCVRITVGSPEQNARLLETLGAST